MQACASASQCVQPDGWRWHQPSFDETQGIAAVLAMRAQRKVDTGRLIKDDERVLCHV